MEVKQLKIEEPVSLEGLIIIPISQIALYSSVGGGGIYLNANKKALAVVLVSSSQRIVYTISGECLTLEYLLLQLPGLHGLLDSLSGS